MSDMKINLEKLSLRELNSLLKAAERLQASQAARRPAVVVRAELIAFAASCGYTIEELLGSQYEAHAAAPRRSKLRRVGKALVKYRDPDNKRHTWSGRGSIPVWLADKVRRGQLVADFLLPGLARPTAKKNRRIGQRSVFKSG